MSNMDFGGLSIAANRTAENVQNNIINGGGALLATAGAIAANKAANKATNAAIEALKQGAQDTVELTSTVGETATKTSKIKQAITWITDKFKTGKEKLKESKLGKYTSEKFAELKDTKFGKYVGEKLTALKGSKFGAKIADIFKTLKGGNGKAKMFKALASTAMFIAGIFGLKWAINNGKINQKYDDIEALHDKFIESMPLK